MVSRALPSASFHTEFICRSRSRSKHILQVSPFPSASCKRAFSIICCSFSGEAYNPQSRDIDRHADHNNNQSHGYYRETSPFHNPTVSVFWDLDNKPPKSSAYHAALYLKHAASRFGHVIEMIAYANRNAFLHIPEWVRKERQERKKLDFLEQKGLVTVEQPYVCTLCGRKCRTHVLLKKHFQQLHEREQKKRMARLGSLKGKKRTKYREKLRPKSERYNEAARPILVPKAGFGLESDLRRAGVYVRTVQYKPQAADIALKKSMEESMNKGIKCMCLVSDDTDFAHMLVDARSHYGLTTLVFGESTSLKRYSDYWFPWDDISQGVPRHDFEEAVRAWTQPRSSWNLNVPISGDSFFLGRPRSTSSLTLGNDLPDNDAEMEHKFFMGGNPRIIKPKFSAFSDEEREDVDDFSREDTDIGGHWLYDDDDDDNEEEEEEEKEDDDEEDDDDSDWEYNGVKY